MAIYSHSKLSTFEQCSLKYKYKYIDKIEPEIKQTIEGFLGNIVHDVLEWIYINANKRTFELDDVVKKYAELWNEKYNSEIKIVKQEFDVEYYFNNGIRFLINYFLKHTPFKDNTIATEKRIVIDLNSDGKYLVQGYIDRLVHNKENNVFEIHDYKTGAIKSQSDLDKDRQLALYSLGVRKSFDNVEDVHLIWHFLNHDKQLSSKRTIEQLKQLKQEIITLIDKIESTTEFPSNPGCLCRWCEFQKTCPDYNEEPEKTNNYFKKVQETFE